MNNFELSTTNWQLADKQENNDMPGKQKLLEAALPPGNEEARKLQKLQKHRSFEKNPMDSDP